MERRICARVHNSSGSGGSDVTCQSDAVDKLRKRKSVGKTSTSQRHQLLTTKYHFRPVLVVVTESIAHRQNGIVGPVVILHVVGRCVEVHVMVVGIVVHVRERRWVIVIVGMGNGGVTVGGVGIVWAVVGARKHWCVAVIGCRVVDVMHLQV